MNEISIAIKISRFDFETELLSMSLSLTPSRSHYKGETYTLDTSNGQVTKQYAYYYWEYRIEYKTEEWEQSLINKFIDDIVTDRREELKKIKKNASLEFFIGINYYNVVNPGFHFDARRLALLADIGFELDFDLYNFTT
jgi:hypothetical protein